MWHLCGTFMIFMEPVAEAKQQLQRHQLFSTLSCVLCVWSRGSTEAISGPC